MTTPAAPAKSAHIVVVPFEAWGHVRPLLHLTVQLLTLHPNLHITHLLSTAVAARVNKELASSNFSHARADASILARMQLVDVEAGGKGGKGEFVVDLAAKYAAFAEAIAGYFTALFGGPNAVGLENKFQGMVPTCAIFDMVQAFVPFVVHQVTSAMGIPPIFTFTFSPTGPTAAIHHIAKEEDGGFLAALQRLVGEGMQRGEDPLDIIAPLGMGDRGIMKSLPGLPTMTDYELHPGLGSCPLPPQLVLVLFKTYEAAWSPIQTGGIGVAVEEMESDAKKWLEKDTGKPFLSVGFQYSDDVWQGKVAPPASTDVDGLKAIAFLDEMLKTKGSKSVIYISFGSAYFPFARIDLVHHLIDTLVSTSTPFLFAYATELFPVSPDLLDKVHAAEFGLAVHVAPQVQVLHHPATGFFLSHCGGSSMAEAIVANVPIVAWPFAADQGEHCVILKKYDAAIDLKQIKCFLGTGTKPTVLYDGTELVGTEEAIKAEMVDLWGQLKGDLGQKLIKGMGELHELCKKSCGEGGKSRQAMLDFAKYF